MLQVLKFVLFGGELLKRSDVLPSMIIMVVYLSGNNSFLIHNFGTEAVWSRMIIMKISITKKCHFGWRIAQSINSVAAHDCDDCTIIQKLLVLGRKSQDCSSMAEFRFMSWR